MSDDPYRETKVDCPSCRKGPMRAYRNRLVCDDCTGIFLTEADLKQAIGEVTGQDTALSFIDAGTADAQCPTCRNPMIGSTLDIAGFFKLSDPIPRCAGHGVWLASGKLAGIFATLTHRLHFGAAQGRAYGGVGGQGNSSYQMLRDRSKPSAPRPPAIDPYAGQTLGCPACGAATTLGFHGDRWLCPGCNGAFVENAALESLVTDVSKQWFTLPPPKGDAGSRACPVCAQALVVEPLHGVTIDRCARHGIWFDPSELTLALETAGGVAEEPRGIGRWISRLFGG